MSEPLQSLKLLIVEDREDDALLMVRVLRRGGFSPIWTRVETAIALRSALQDESWDAVVSDYSLPGFDAAAALAIVKQSQLDLPFIVVSGSIGERLAVELMRSGAHDYLMKDNLARLPEAMRRELRDAQVRASRRQAEVLLKRQLAAIEAAIDGIAIVQNDRYLYANPSYHRLFGDDRAEDLLDRHWQSMYAPPELHRFEVEIFPALARDRAWQGEILAQRRDGSPLVQGLSLTLTDDGLLISVSRDISDLKQARDLLLHNALHDPLTGLPNRKLLAERIELALQRSQRDSHYRYAVLFVDLDRFKVVNDSLGHLVGDRLLIEIAQRLQQQVRAIDLIARLGGDEFAILLDNIHDTQDVIHISERILAHWQAPFEIDGHEIFSSLSIGIVLGDTRHSRPEDLIRDADIAMYRAKRQSGSAYRFFDAQMHAQAVERLNLEMDLRRALQHEEFVLYYQPIFNILESRLVGFEALVRWQHPQRGFISPDAFVPLAEETGFVVALDRWVLREACQQMARWQRQFPQWFPLKVSVNLAAQDLLETGLIEDVDRVLETTQLGGSAIDLEITERMLVDDIDRTLDLLAQLNNRQIQISIDDFGTGYSSLNYLHRLPVDRLKIDRSFVQQLGWQDSDCHVVDTIVTLSHKLGLAAVAEGIETPQQLSFLQQLGCTFGQGYLFSKPLCATDIERVYLHQPAIAM